MSANALFLGTVAYFRALSWNKAFKPSSPSFPRRDRGREASAGPGSRGCLKGEREFEGTRRRADVFVFLSPSLLLSLPGTDDLLKAAPFFLSKRRCFISERRKKLAAKEKNGPDDGPGRQRRRRSIRRRRSSCSSSPQTTQLRPREGLARRMGCNRAIHARFCAGKAAGLEALGAGTVGFFSFRIEEEEEH